MLFFEPLTCEDVLNVCDRIAPDGVIVQFGGQTPLNLARALQSAGVPIIGTSVDTIEAADQLRETLLLELPEIPRCSADCKGLCPSCGANLNEGACSCEPENQDEEPVPNAGRHDDSGTVSPVENHSSENYEHDLHHNGE